MVVKPSEPDGLEAEIAIWKAFADCNQFRIHCARVHDAR